MCDSADSIPCKPLFPCLSPLKRDMQSSDVRVSSFGDRWKSYISPREMADAGFYYQGENDCVCCYYCGGGLKNWKQEDNAWYEHAKWYPLCEYVLRKQGVEFVRKICSDHFILERPTIDNPCLSNATKSIRDILNKQTDAKMTDPRMKEREKREIDVKIMMLLDPDVAYAKKIGIENDRIVHALAHQLEKYSRKFSNRKELLNAILD